MPVAAERTAFVLPCKKSYRRSPFSHVPPHELVERRPGIKNSMYICKLEAASFFKAPCSTCLPWLVSAPLSGRARGKAVDRRADIWAFGCVLFEMLAGARAFAGDDVTSTLAAVLKDDVKWAALPPSVPAPVRTLLRRCLEKPWRSALPPPHS